MSIELTRDEKRALKRYLFDSLSVKCEYHPDLTPKSRDSLNVLMQKYFYWADEYNGDFIPECSYQPTERIHLYLIQEFDRFMAIPVSVRY